MKELYHRFQQLAEEYSSLKFQCEDEVKTWKWATSDLFDPRPFYYKRNREKPGSFLKMEPLNLEGKHEYGYDDLGRVRVERIYVDTTARWGVRYYENFNTYQDNIVNSVYFSYHSDKEPINCKRSTYLNERIILWEFQVKRGSFRERYHWQDDKLVLIEIERIDFEDPNIFTEPQPYQKIEPTYNSVGILEKLTLYQDNKFDLSPKSFTLYQKPDPKLSFKKLVDLVKNRLIESIIQKVGTLNLAELIYCIALVWSPGQSSSLPPYLSFGLNREREQWINEHKDEAKMYFWNTAEFSVYADLRDDTELTKLCELLNQECGLSDRWNHITKMLNEVAKILGTFNWIDRVKTTSDFVVFANDIEGADLRQNFNFSVPSNLLKQFKKSGWLP